MNEITYRINKILHRIEIQFSTRYLIRNVLIGGIFVFFTIIGIFVFWFRDQNISHEVGDWGAFGDFIGGILNPIISFLSLVLLTYITILVSKNSSKDSKNQFLLQKRIEAFDHLNKFLPFFINFENSLKKSSADIERGYRISGPFNFNEFMQKWIKEDKFDLLQNLSIFKEFYSQFLGFRVNFSSYFLCFEDYIQNYNQAIEKIHNLNFELNLLQENIDDINFNKLKCTKSFQDFTASYDKFLRNIKSELN